MFSGERDHSPEMIFVFTAAQATDGITGTIAFDDF
jgi:hypothetical protein